MWSLILLILFTASNADVPDSCEPVDASDPLEVYLLTSGPGNGVYTKVGHSALWVSGGGKRETVFNWGAYDSSQDNFLFHFFMGDAEYKLAMMSRQYNLKRVKENNQRLVAQHLDLSPNMKMALAAELARLARPENHVYTYHWEHQNCSTLIRDIIDESTNGSLRDLTNSAVLPTRRFEVLRHLGSLGWAWFGWHYMASDYGDKTYDRWSWLHIPEALHNGAKEATIQWEGESTERLLVDKTCVLNEGEWAPKAPPSRAHWLWGVGFAMGLWIWVTRERARAWHLPTLLFFGFSGALSSFFLGCWLLSDLEGYGFNENWFYSNPFHFVFIYQLLHKRHSAWFRSLLRKCMIMGILIGLGWKVFDPSTQSNLGFIGLFGLPTVIFAIAQHQRSEDHS